MHEQVVMLTSICGI